MKLESYLVLEQHLADRRLDRHLAHTKNILSLVSSCSRWICAYGFRGGHFAPIDCLDSRKRKPYYPCLVFALTRSCDMTTFNHVNALPRLSQPLLLAETSPKYRSAVVIAMNSALSIQGVR